jgi:N-methylhydantoinase A
MILIGVDIGGTFTDFVSYDSTNSTLKTFKILSTPEDPSIAVIQGIQRISSECSEDRSEFACVHGSTVATNALLERKGANTALITTSGFKDILQIGRQNRSDLYNFFVETPEQLVPPDQRFEVTERIDSKGNVLVPLDPVELDAILLSMRDQKIESVAISLIFSFLYPAHEEMISYLLSDRGFHISISSKILPEFREYERTSTTVVNAYVSPILEKYLKQLSLILQDIHLRVMQSNGGMISIKDAQEHGVRCILSGPAGGVIGAEFISKEATLNARKNQSGRKDKVRLITFDMGGTSTDVSLIDGSPGLTSDSIIDGNPIRIPMLDIHTIGAGGGSIAYIDHGGALRVGPMSAGADPGPACYGKGELPTVTDAHMVLGRINPDVFLGGSMPLDRSRSILAISTLAGRLGIDTTHTALGIIEIANAHMTRALRVISVERGHDPRDFTLFAFGGAGGLHASDLARSVGIHRVIISPYASTLSALGMLTTDIVKDYVQTVMLPGDYPIPKMKEKFESLRRKAIDEFTDEGISEHNINFKSSLDMRYKGQSYELNIPFNHNIFKSFESAHQNLYGYSNPNFAIEIVNLRLRGIGKMPKIKLFPQKYSYTTSESALLEHQRIMFSQGEVLTPIYKGELLKFGNQLIGPAIVVRSDTTILLNQNDECTIDPFLNMIITINRFNS